MDFSLRLHTGAREGGKRERDVWKRGMYRRRRAVVTSATALLFSCNGGFCVKKVLLPFSPPPTISPKEKWGKYAVAHLHERIRPMLSLLQLGLGARFDLIHWRLVYRESEHDRTFNLSFFFENL